MSFATDIIKKVAGFAAENSPAILTAIGAAGAITSSYLAVKATVTVMDEIHEEETNGPNGAMSNRERAEFVMDSGLWRNYIPAAATCLGTVACIIGATTISSRKAAGVAAAYSLLEKGATEYQEKVAEKFGEKKEQEVRSEILADRLKARDPMNDDSIEVWGRQEGKSVFQDSFSQMYVWTDRVEIGEALVDIGKTINDIGYASLADFYYRLDIPAPAYANDIGWSSNDHRPTARFSSAMTPAEVPVNAFDISPLPNPDFRRFH
jgi:hypothetical protein